MERGQHYQVPLEKLFASSGRGQVMGAETQLSGMKGIEYVEIELEIKDDDELRGDVVQALRRGPRGLIVPATPPNLAFHAVVTPMPRHP